MGLSFLMFAVDNRNSNKQPQMIWHREKLFSMRSGGGGGNCWGYFSAAAEIPLILLRLKSFHWGGGGGDKNEKKTQTGQNGKLQKFQVIFTLTAGVFGVMSANGSQTGLSQSFIT